MRFLGRKSSFYSVHRSLLKPDFSLNLSRRPVAGSDAACCENKRGDTFSLNSLFSSALLRVCSTFDSGRSFSVKNTE